MVPYLASFSSDKEDKAFFLSKNNVKLLFSDFFKTIFSRKYKNYKIYFHNLSGFDGVFLLKRLVDLKYKIEAKVLSGKIIQILVSREKVGLNFTLNDSLLMMLQSLDKLAKSFIPCFAEAESISLGKGIFPYFLSDIKYNGPFPSYNLFPQDKVSLSDYEKEAKKFSSVPWK
jgi:hypothetical protein